MKVSVVMPTYNRAKMLPAAIQSYLDQDYEGDCELFIFNNGSTDETQEIIDRYREKARPGRSINYLQAKYNTLPPENFNFLIDHVYGDLICHLHDDDRLTKDSLTLRVNKFKQDPSLDVIWAGWYVGDRFYPGLPPDYERILRDEYINFTSLMWRKHVDAIMDKRLRYYHDWLFKIRCFQRYKVGHIEEPVMHYGVHLGQASVKCRQEGMNGPEEALMREILKNEP